MSVVCLAFLTGVATFARLAKCADQHTCRPIAAWSARPVIGGLGKTFGVVFLPGAGRGRCVIG